MRTRVLSLTAAALLVLALFGADPVSYAATDEEIENSIVMGLAWLAEQQDPVDGGWGLPWDCDRVSRTGLALLKFETRAHELRLDPLGPEYEYGDQVAMGLAYLVTQGWSIPIVPQPAGDPDGNGNGLGMYFTGCGGHQTYNSGIALMALVASGHPELYGVTAQDTLDYLAFAQVEAGCPVDPPECAGFNRGGWGYEHNTCDWSDNSNGGYASLGIGFAAAPAPFGFGLTIPAFVPTELSLWLSVLQDPVNGDADDGGSWYNPCWLWSPWVNILKTGNMLYEMALTGDTPTTARVMDAIDYIERHWNDPAGCDAGWRGHRQAMFTMMKGFEALNIDLLDLDGDGVPETDWFDAVSTELVMTQNPDGSWPWDCWGDQVLSTAWALLTLERAVPPVEFRVFVDIKPQSCPNPFNVGPADPYALATARKTLGVLPVAVLGTADFDVLTIDPATIALSREGVVDENGDPVFVRPSRYAFEDVATPFEGELCDCHTLGPDGYTDLTLKFRTLEVIEALQLSDVLGQSVALSVTGNLWPEAGEPGPGQAFHGEDCVWVLGE